MAEDVRHANDQWIRNNYLELSIHPPMELLWFVILSVAVMATLLRTFRRASNSFATEAPVTVDNMYEQYRTTNLVKVFKDLYPAPDSTQEEKDALMEKRMEVAKSAKGLQQEKKLFTLENETAAKQLEEAGVKIRDFAS
ncbi:hypothetical protein H2200_001300 [Cladophialophora chaetospira]|uniref:Uncharacterized protein n=1 Tax=Cladophialophora chaetospira TaxID=386627 RepID=A0AA38XKR1_9EURO|nr:hypothetical protein H2200_001300 [Cladophialophora chaetospira]